MNCSVIEDLLPLYADDCCSEASKKLVEEHLDSCPNCRSFLDSMRSEVEIPNNSIPAGNRLHLWEASLLQAGVYFLLFALMAFGVTMESRTPYGPSNGVWAFGLIIPSTGFLLSMANWYFLPVYRSRKGFAAGTAIAALAATAIALLWGALHYGSFHIFPCLLLSCVFPAASGLLSDIFGKMVGKE